VILPPPFSNAMILTGPTASGKSALALDVAERLGAEIIAMDSMTLYRGMDIGTAKPSSEDRLRVPHHLIDVLDPWQRGSVAWWLDEAKKAVADIESRGRQALFVGGTPFYLKALVHGLFDSPPVDAELRRRLEKEAATIGPAEFHAKLIAVDPPSASRLHRNDTRRLVRALEVWCLTGKPLSEWQQQNWWGETPEKLVDDFPRCLVVDLPREQLYERINKRVELMVAEGWMEEVRTLRSSPDGWSKESAHALGYREMGAVLDGRMALPDAVAEVQLRSRQFAKRQLTWFRGLAGCRFVEGKLTIDLWHRKMS